MNPRIRIQKIEEIIKTEHMTEYIREHKDSVVYYCEPTEDQLSLNLPYNKYFKSVRTGKTVKYEKVEDSKYNDPEFVATAIRAVLMLDRQIEEIKD